MFPTEVLQISKATIFPSGILERRKEVFLGLQESFVACPKLRYLDKKSQIILIQTPIKFYLFLRYSYNKLILLFGGFYDPCPKWQHIKVNRFLSLFFTNQCINLSAILYKIDIDLFHYCLFFVSKCV